MPSFNSTSKALARLVSHRNLSRNRLLKCSDYNKIRCLCSIAGAGATSCSNKKLTRSYVPEFGISNNSVFIQKRGFLGCGDGEEGNMLSKLYEERRVLGYSPEQLYAVVAAADLYEDFLPWCQRSEIIQHNPDGSFDAELEIGFKFLVESYVSHVELNKSKSVKTTSSQSSLFDHLINIWEFNPGPVPGTCNLYFLVDFKFQSPLYRQMANMFFKEVVSRLVGSFNDRCRLIYGPGVTVLEHTYEQRA
ncbi:Polyketide cyclase/dehydrase and lipid transport protein [Abeliophyllum distichum]|uniref:Polyketide cyclase/dehydrase and lipid transport protein n=1 Tax=Abeliophyllum distichum TaxID=126358 RepID=A0ABD1SBX8_9LAMI